MKTQEAVTRTPELEAIRSDLVKLKVMWSMCCITPVLYLAIAQIVAGHVFIWQEAPGFFPLESANYRMLLLGIFGLVLLIQGVIFYVRKYYGTRMRTGSRHAAKLLQCYTRRTLMLVVLSEITALSGFLLFMLNGRLSEVFLLGMIGLVYYAQSYPSETGIREISRGR